MLNSFHPDMLKTRETVIATAKGPCWYTEIDRPDMDAVVGGVFPTKAELIQFVNRVGGGNRHETEVIAGRSVEIIVYQHTPGLKAGYQRWGDELAQYGTTE